MGTKYWRSMERINSNCNEWLITYSHFQQTFIEHQLCAECCALAFIYVLTVTLGTYGLRFTNYVSGMIPSDMVSFVGIIPPPNNPVESVCTFAPTSIFVMWEQRIELSTSQSGYTECGRIGFLSGFCGDLRLKAAWGPYCEEHCVP